MGCGASHFLFMKLALTIDTLSMSFKGESLCSAEHTSILCLAYSSKCITRDSAQKSSIGPGFSILILLKFVPLGSLLLICLLKEQSPLLDLFLETINQLQPYLHTEKTLYFTSSVDELWGIDIYS